ncbi:MAG: hypothetical protein R3Y21_04500 [Mycoplasmatota bacterium]
MPSIAAHLAVSKLISGKLNIKNKIEFNNGTIYPDVVKNLHYRNKNGSINIKKFLNNTKYKDEFLLGELTHLLLDKYFMEKFIKPKLDLKKDFKFIFSKEGIYNDYSIINNRLINDFSINRKQIIKNIDFKDNINSEIAEYNLKFLDNDIIGKTKYISYSEVKNFLVSITDIIINDLVKIISTYDDLFTTKSYISFKNRIIKQYEDNYIIKKINKNIIELYNMFFYNKNDDLFYIESEIIKKLKFTNIILEGTDGIGKTTLAKEFLKKGFVVQDRSEDVICKYMFEDISLETRIYEFKKFLRGDNVFLVFLITQDKEELLRRINQRKEINKFDKKAWEYNLMYINTYEKLKNIKNIHGIDVTNLKLNDIIEKILEKRFLYENRYL